MQLNQEGVDEGRRLARELLAASSELASRVHELILRSVPELAPVGDAEAVAIVRESTEQNIGAILSTLAFGVAPATLEPPARTQELLSNINTAGGDVTQLLRAYRLGHQLIWEVWSEHVYAEIRDPGLLPVVLQASSAHFFEYIEGASQRIVEAAPSTRTRGGVLQLNDRAGLVGKLLGSDPVEIGAASAMLGYELTRHHVALAVSPLGDFTDVRHQLDRLLAAAQVPVIAIPSGDGSWWGWLGFARDPSAAELEAFSTVDIAGVIAGLGEPGQGREGFRRSLTQAREATRVAQLGPGPAPGLVGYRDTEIAGMLCADPDRARELAARRLGRLAERDQTNERLRATVRALLANGHNRARAAEMLHVHHKTVAYRISQAEELLGHSLAEDSFGLQVALLIDQTLHGP